MAKGKVARIAAKMKAAQRQSGQMDMRAVFAGDASRFNRFSARMDDLLIDYSKCAVDEAVMAGLFEAAKAAGVEKNRAAMFAGKAINSTEGRAVLHTARPSVVLMALPANIAARFFSTPAALAASNRPAMTASSTAHLE